MRLLISSSLRYIIIGILLLMPNGSLLAAGSILSRGSATHDNTITSDISMRSETLKRMDDIKAALEKFARANKVLPCPTTSTSTASTLGTAVSTTTPTTACAGDSAGTTTNANIVEGMVPVRTLNLPMDYAYDAWGRRILYVIDRRFAHKGDTAQGLGTLTSSATETSSYSNTRVGDLIVYDKAGAGRQPITGGRGPAALLISYGTNGYGGYPKNGQRISYASASLDERANIATSSTSVITDFVKAPTSATFDDIVYIVPRLEDVPFLCPDRGTGFNAYGNTPAGPGYPAYSWADPAMTMSLSNPADRLFYKACMGTTVNATTGAVTCNGAVCYSGRLQRTCKISTDTNKTYAS